MTLSSCTWTKHQFFGEDQTAQNPNGSGYPYYYSASAPANTSGAIDANEQQPFYATQQGQPAQPDYSQVSGYSAQSNSSSVNVQFGNKGTDVSAGKVGEATPNPNPILPSEAALNADQYRRDAIAAQNSLPKLPTSPQYQPQPQYPYPPAPYPTTQYPASYGAPQQTPPVVAPYQQPAYGYQQPPQFVQPQPVITPQPIQPQPIATGQPAQGGLTYEQYQQMYYGQPPYNVPPYQYPPVR